MSESRNSRRPGHGSNPQERKPAERPPLVPKLSLWTSPTLLGKLERTLTRAKEKLTPQDRKTQSDLEQQVSEEDRYIVWLVEDAIQKVKAGVFQPAQIK